MNGESWLALAEYSRAFPQDAGVAATLSELDEYLIDRYSNSPNPEFYHWGTMTAALRLQMTGDPRFGKFIHDQADWFLQLVSGARGAAFGNCAWVEGLATAYPAMEQTLGAEDPLLARLSSRIGTVMTRTRSLQILPGQDAFTLDSGVKVRSAEFPRYAGAFLISPTNARTQVDVVGHCLSALIRMQKAGLSLPAKQ